MKRLLPCLLLAAMLPLSAQFSLSGKDRGDKPILINSDSMDVDMENGKATFYGNVIVNDQDVTITCQKMVLYQEPKADRKKDKKKDGSISGDAKLERIECIDDVVITRKNSGDKSHWGTCGKAIYFHKKGSVTMMSEPVLYQDESKITGTRLTFFRDSKRIEGTDIKISARNLTQEAKDPKNPVKKIEKPQKNQKEESFEDFYKKEKPAPEPGRKLTQKEKDAILGLDTPAGKN